MGQQGSEAFVGLDVAKVHNAVAIADAGRTGEIRYIGEIPNTPEATRKLVAKLIAIYDELHFGYEAARGLRVSDIVIEFFIALAFMQRP